MIPHEHDAATARGWGSLAAAVEDRDRALFRKECAKLYANTIGRYWMTRQCLPSHGHTG